MTTGVPTLEATERLRRFWTAHGRSHQHLEILRAVSSSPAVSWTPELLSVWYGLPPQASGPILRELAASGILRRAGGLVAGFAWNGELDWAVPRSPAGREIARIRWRNGRDGEDETTGT